MCMWTAEIKLGGGGILKILKSRKIHEGREGSKLEVEVDMFSINSIHICNYQRTDFAKVDPTLGEGSRGLRIV